MKKSTRLLSALLAFLMLISGMSITAFAKKFPIVEPVPLDEVGKVYLSIDQYGTALVDMIEEALAKADIYENLGSMDTYGFLIGNLPIDLRTVDDALDSIVRLMDEVNNNFLVTIIGIFGLGQIKDINDSAIRNGPRRRSATTTDLQVIYSLFDFLYDNRVIIGDAVGGTLDLGIIGSFLDINATIGDVSLKIKEFLYDALFDSEIYGAMPANMTCDQMITKFVNNLLVYDPTTQETGLMPSASGQLNIFSGKSYTFFKNVFNSALKDIVIPMLMDLLVDLLEIDTTTTPDGVLDMSNEIVSIAWPMVVDNGKITFTPAAQGKPIPMLREALEYYVFGDFLSLYLNKPDPAVADSGFSLKDTFDEAIRSFLMMGAGLLGSMNVQGVTVLPTADLELMTNSQLFSYLGKLLVIGLIKFSDIPDTCTTLREVGTYLLINIAQDVIPEKNFYAKIASGQINPATTGALDVAAALGRYYLNANFVLNIPDDLNFDQTVTFIVNWFIQKYGGVFYTNGFSGLTAWQKIDRILFGNQPTYSGLLQQSWLPNTVNPNNVTYDLIVNKILFSIVDFDFGNLLSILGKNPTGELNKPIITVLLNIVGRLINGMFGNNVVLQRDMASLDTLISKNGLKTFVVNLCTLLKNYDNIVIPAALPIFAQLMGIVDTNKYEMHAPTGSLPQSIATLKTRLSTQVPVQENVEYDEPGYVFWGSEDYVPLYKYYRYMDVREEAEKLISRYEDKPESVTEFEITDAVFRLENYYGSMTKRTQLVKTQLDLIITRLRTMGLINADYTMNAENTNYSLRSWNQLKRAYAFADSVSKAFILGSPSLTQVKITEARHQLIYALKGLKPNEPLADYTMFNYIYDMASALDLNKYISSSADALAEVLAAATKFPRDYGQSEQEEVDDIVSEIQEAMAMLVFKLAIVPVEGSTTIVDRVNHIVYGLAPGLTSIFAYLTFVGSGGNVRMNSATPTIATGSVVELYDNVNRIVHESFTIVILGDVNGDSFVNGCDSIYANLHSNVTSRAAINLNKYQMMAADLNRDGNVNTTDITRLENAGINTYTVSQTSIRIYN